MLKSSHRPGPAASAIALGLSGVLLSAAPGHSSSLQSGTFYQDSSNRTSSAPPVAGACNGIGYCYILFTRVPAGKRLAVTHVSCSLSVSSATAEASSMYLGTRRTTGAVERFTMLVPGTMPSNQPGYTLVLNSAALQLYEAGDRPEIYVGLNSAASTTGFCTIAGQMTDVL